MAPSEYILDSAYIWQDDATEQELWVQAETEADLTRTWQIYIWGI